MYNLQDHIQIDVDTTDTDTEWTTDIAEVVINMGGKKLFSNNNQIRSDLDYRFSGYKKITHVNLTTYMY